ncbi:MAG: glycosyltransferase [Bacteroidia bacterium]|nr:glycosyltransferase [Bacteroidia bacterium]
MTKQLHILFLASWYPNITNPLLGNFVQRHAQAIATINKVTVVHSVNSTKNKIEISNDDHFTTITNNSSNGVLGYYNKLKLIVFVIMYCRKNDVDIVHLNVAYPMGIIALALKYICNKKYVISENWSVYQHNQYLKKSYLFRFVNKLIFRNAAYILPVSAQMQMQLRNIAPHNKYEIISNVVDTNLFNYSPISYEQSTDTFKFIHISTLDDAAKNTTGIIHAVQLLRKLTPLKFELLIVAETSYAHLQALAQRLNITKYIRFEGPLIHSQVANRLANAHSHILFSNYEGMPCVMIEAMACGKPIIGTTVGGMPEIITPETGLLVTPKNTEMLANAMLQLMLNYNNYNTQHIRTFALNTFSTTAIANKFNCVYNQIV